MSKYPNITRSQDDAIADKLGGEPGVARFLAGETIVVPKPTFVSAQGLSNGGVTFASALDSRLFLDDQRTFFREVYGKPLPRVKMPSQRPGFSWGLVMAPFMSRRQWLYDLGKERFGGAVWKYSDESLDELIASDERDPKDGAYAFFCRDRVEADEEHKNKSYDQIHAAAIKGMTWAERWNLGLWFHYKTGQHLDINSWTLCTGSLYRGGGVPSVKLNGAGKVGVRWCGQANALDSLRSREVVLAG